MAQKVIGLDIGIYSLKICEVKDTALIRSATEKLPEQLVQKGHDAPTQEMADFIRQALRKNKIRGKAAAVSLPADVYYVRRVKMPLMTTRQLAVNLPYEFRDYITGDPDGYVFDYSVLKISDKEMDLMAACMSRQLVTAYRDMLKKAGLKLVKLVPDVLCLQSILFRDAPAGQTPQDYAVLDLGHRATRMYFFSGGAYEITRTLDSGGPAMARTIADEKGLSLYHAQQYLEQNKDNVLDLPALADRYDEVNTEITRVMNFYSYNNSSNNIDRIYYFGSGFDANRLKDTIRESTGLPMLPLEQIFPENARSPQLQLGPQSYGCVIE